MWRIRIEFGRLRAIEDNTTLKQNEINFGDYVSLRAIEDNTTLKQWINEVS